MNKCTYRNCFNHAITEYRWVEPDGITAASAFACKEHPVSEEILEESRRVSPRLTLEILDIEIA